MKPVSWRVIGTGLLTLGFATLMGLAAGGALSQPDTPPAPVFAPDQTQFFEAKIRPVLLANCVSCHGKDAAGGGLRLDTRAFLVKGGDNGSAIAGGGADAAGKSLVITAVRHTENKLRMPKGAPKLAPAVIADFEAWAAMGFPWTPEKGEAGATAAPAPNRGDTLSAEARKFWSLRPVEVKPPPKVKNPSWVRSPMDAFILARLEAKHLAPAAPADRATLLRRVTYDLTGLPPTSEEAEAFARDMSPNAYEKVVDRLLASPRYGERQARLWLDVARYADTKGYMFTEDRAYPWAYTYRDWVINAFNRDLPWDQFVTDQLAADLLPSAQTEAGKRDLAALGFITVGRRFLNNTHDIIDDRIDVTMRGFQGATVACARCHDHKFDPIPTKDYYSLYAVFNATRDDNRFIAPDAQVKAYQAHEAKINAATDVMKKAAREAIADLRARTAKNEIFAEPVKKALDAAPSVKDLDENKATLSDEAVMALAPAFAPALRDRITIAVKERDALRKTLPPEPARAMAVADVDKPSPQRVFKRGNAGNQGDEVPRRFALCLSPVDKPRALWTRGSGRLELARAIASPQNPRTARVLVNRIWLSHFGAGLVRTPSDFGKQGEPPTHPELLDYLAGTFVRDGWSIKKLHRRILLSATYRQSADAPARTLAMDPENRLVSRMNRRRLDLEQMRDSLLCASGRLDSKKVGGPSEELWNAPWTKRRAVYGYIERQNLPGTFRTFDFAGPDATSAQRYKTTVPQQALFVMNSPLAVEQARALAARAGAERDLSERVRRLYRLALNRAPDADELTFALQYLEKGDKPGAGPTTDTPVWSYGWGNYDEKTNRVASWTPFNDFTGDYGGMYRQKDYLTGAGVRWAMLSAGGGHPGSDAQHAAIRRFIVPANGVATITGTVDRPAKEGDGVRARVVSSRTGKAGEWIVSPATRVETSVQSVAVQKGDTLDFVVDSGLASSDNCDSFFWSPTISIAPAAPKTAARVFSAAKAFAPPPAAAPKPLTRWERYAQAILMTNEWMFVD